MHGVHLALLSRCPVITAAERCGFSFRRVLGLSAGLAERKFKVKKALLFACKTDKARSANSAIPYRPLSGNWPTAGRRALLHSSALRFNLPHSACGITVAASFFPLYLLTTSCWSVPHYQLFSRHCANETCGDSQ